MVGAELGRLILTKKSALGVKAGSAPELTSAAPV
jgi:hypothetical protein